MPHGVESDDRHSPCGGFHRAALDCTTGKFLALHVRVLASVAYGKGSHTLTRDRIGTRCVFAAVRMLVDPTQPDDFKQVHALQDAIRIDQKSAGRLELPTWDMASQKQVRDALLALNDTLPDLRHAGGKRNEVDPVRHLIATASGWGLNPDQDAIYLNITPAKNDRQTAYRMSVKDVPVDGFWSVTVYDASGHFQKNSFDAYSINNLTAKKGADGSVTIQFGGCDGKVPSCLPITKGWNYMVRLYRPRDEILTGRWVFPEATMS
ncbi:MAG TPA: DUF1214 domain-containing protein [Burkholderiaceae bacterium]|nr:DUF1214 domain-containing protein [Burkholderiaceae bacterium]